MKKLWFVGLLLVLATLPTIFSQEAEPKFHKGAKPTPFPKLVAAIKAGKVSIYKATAAPPQVVVVPKRLSVWGNNKYGICVTSESCFAIVDYSTYIGIPEIYVTEAKCIEWARERNYLNGAYLLEVIEDMQKDGIKDEKGVLRKAGKASTVDYSNEETLKSGLAQGPLSIAIDSSALPSGAGSANGWYVEGGRAKPNTDHCVSLCGYGPAKVMFPALGVAVPSGISPDKTFYALFTWGTIGLIDHKWLLGTCVEAWVRNPTTVGLEPPPPPQPTDLTVACANVTGAAGASVKFMPLAKGGTSPYIFLFEYGDGAQDASGSHTYGMAGTYTVTVTAVDSAGKLGSTTCSAIIGSTPQPPSPGGLAITLPRDTPAGTYQLVLPSDLDEIQRRLDAIRGKK